MNPEIGRRFGPYEIQSRLGGGGMGHVFRAWDARLHREVAVKLLNHEYAMPGMRERFLREARAASALNHPNICTIFDIGEQDGDPYLVMELLEGETLKDRILNRTMQLDEIVSVARDTAEALGAAHSKGVVHRDVKPANIFLVDKANGGVQAKVLDFGLAKIEGGVLGARGRSLDLTTVGATVGTLAYMSPEQARGEALDSRSDLFSLGVVMYEMATRQVPFQGATSALVFVQLLNHPPEPVREWNDTIPRELEKVILKLLAKERTARFQTARELELALIALPGKGSNGGGWLRKAVASVPLVRAADPVAREKRLARAKGTSDPGLQAPPGRPVTPVPAAIPARSLDEAAISGNPSDQVIRPVARLPRPDATPNPARNPAAPANGSAGPTQLPLRAMPSGNLTPSQRLAQGRLNAVAAEAELSNARATTPIPPSVPEPPIPQRPASGDRPQNLVPQPPAVAGAVQPILHPVLDPSEPRAGDDPWDNERDDGVESVSETDETSPRSTAANWSGRRWNLPIHPIWLGMSVLAAIFIACLVFIHYNHSRFSANPLNRADVAVLAEIENRTGDKSLDNSLTEALRLELAQSRYFTLRSGDSYRSAHRLIALAAAGNPADGGIVLARKASERLGAKAYIFGSITGSAPYTLHIDLRDVNSNEILASVESHPESLQQVPGAVEEVAGDLRVAAGESRSSVDATSIALAGEASSNLGAVQLYAEAQALISSREPVAALADLQQAIALDPRFIQAQLQLAVLYQQLRAETASADSARLAVAAAAGAGERTGTMAQATFDREASGDYPHASALLRQLIVAYPHDTEALTLLSECLRLQGRMAEALSYAQQAYTEDSFNGPAYAQAEMALIGLDRFDAAYQLDLQAQRLGLAVPGDSLAAADLDGRQEIVAGLIADLPVGKIEYRPDWAYGIYLDNAGRLAAGAALWRSRAEAAQQNDSLKSAATFLLAQGALDRALLGDCTAALAMLPPSGSQPLQAGRTALFDIGAASALCGDRARATASIGELRAHFPQSFEVNGYFVADIQAAEHLHDNQPGAALNDLASARGFDLISITPFLRGLAQVAQHGIAVGIVDFQTELAHRGIIYLDGNDVYPAAQIGLARAFADSGDLGNSAEAYRRFLVLWNTADPGSPLPLEARTHRGL